MKNKYLVFLICISFFSSLFFISCEDELDLDVARPAPVILYRQISVHSDTTISSNDELVVVYYNAAAGIKEIKTYVDDVVFEDTIFPEENAHVQRVSDVNLIFDGYEDSATIYCYVKDWRGLEAYDTIVVHYVSTEIPPQKPQAYFSIYNDSTWVGTEVSFYDHSLFEPTGRTWDFGDGSSASEKNITHIYSQAGTYTVKLTVWNEYGVDSIIKEDCVEILPLITVEDIDGNIYNTVNLAGKVWTLENLKTTKLNDGTPINLITENTVWSNNSSPAYCYYNNDILNINEYGMMYNVAVVNTSKLCPTGWHVPTKTDFDDLLTSLGGFAYAGQKLKETGSSHWIGGYGATNSSGFTAVGGGYRSNQFFDLGYDTYFFSSTQIDEDRNWSLTLRYNRHEAEFNQSSLNFGGSIRCVKNE